MPRHKPRICVSASILQPLDRIAFAGFAWGLVACAGYDFFRLPNVYVFHLWGDFFGRIGGWATGTSSNYLAGYLWRYLGDGAGIGVVVFIQAAVIGVSSWPRRQVVGLTVAFAVFPVWAGLVLTDALAPAGRALFPLNATTLVLSLAGHLIFGTILGYGLWVSQDRTGYRSGLLEPEPCVEHGCFGHIIDAKPYPEGSLVGHCASVRRALSQEARCISMGNRGQCAGFDHAAS